MSSQNNLVARTIEYNDDENQLFRTIVLEYDVEFYDDMIPLQEIGRMAERVIDRLNQTDKLDFPFQVRADLSKFRNYQMTDYNPTLGRRTVHVYTNWILSTEGIMDNLEAQLRLEIVRQLKLLVAELPIDPEDLEEMGSLSCTIYSLELAEVFEST